MVKNKAVSREANRENLIYFSKILEGVEHFAFFGTMLGLERDGDIIEGDDDIDFYVPVRARDELIGQLANHEVSIVIEENFRNTLCFVQARRKIAGSEVFADFYLFEDNGNGFLVDRWNFSGLVAYPDLALHVPSKFVYPIQKKVFFGCQVSLPRDTRALCEFLYGRAWRQKLQTGTGYRTLIWRNKPLVFVGKSGYLRFKTLQFLKKIRRWLVSAFSA